MTMFILGTLTGIILGVAIMCLMISAKDEQ